MTRVARGAAWSVIGTVSAQVLGLAAMVIASRNLTPDVFGIAGMGLVLVTLVTSIRDLGFAPAITSGRVADDERLFTAHWVLCAAGVVETALLFMAAPLVARFFGNALVGTVLQVQAFMVLLGSATVIPQALLQRMGRYASLAALAATQQALVAAGVAVSIALHAGVWTLVVPSVIASAAMVPLYWLLVGRGPAPVMHLRSIVPLLREGWRVTGSSLCNFLIRNGDNAIVGRVNGERALGLYAFAYNFLMQPLGVFSHAIVPVLLPTFGRLDDTERRSDGTVRTVLALLRLGSPVMIGGALTAHLFVPWIFGGHWSAAIPLVEIFMTLGAVQIVGPVFGSLALAIGDAGLLLRFGLWGAITSLAVFIAGALTAGPIGVAIGYFFHTVALIAVMYLVARRRYGLPLLGLASGIGRIVRDVLLMAGAVVLADGAGALVGLAAGARFAVEVCVGAVAYVAAVRTLARDEAVLLLSLLPHHIGRAGAALLRLTL